MLLYYSPERKQWFTDEEEAKKYENSLNDSCNNAKLEDALQDFDSIRQSYIRDKQKLQDEYEEKLQSGIDEISELLGVS